MTVDILEGRRGLCPKPVWRKILELEDQVLLRIGPYDLDDLATRIGLSICDFKFSIEANAHPACKRVANMLEEIISFIVSVKLNKSQDVMLRRLLFEVNYIKMLNDVKKSARRIPVDKKRDSKYPSPKCCKLSLSTINENP